MRRSFAAGSGLFLFVVVASCGARTGLDAPLRYDASVRSTVDATVHDASIDRGLDAFVGNDGFSIDVPDDCNKPSYCLDSDPNSLYKCGAPYYQCGTLQQCEVRCADGGIADAASDAGGCSAECVNPCLDTLGQNTSNGCEFYAAEMDMIDSALGVCYAVFIVNQWKTGEPAKLVVDNGGDPLPLADFARIPRGFGRGITYEPYDPAVGLPANEVAILFLSRDANAEVGDGGATAPSALANCPAGVVPAIPGNGAIQGTGVGQAFHIRSNVPVVAYQMLPYGGGRARVTGATLLLPTNVWGTNYLAANAYERPNALLRDAGADAAVGEGLARAGPSMVVIAEADDTQVTINPTADILGGPGVTPSSAGTPTTYVIDHGQYLQFTQPAELSGSAIEATKPVAVIAGATLMDVPVSEVARGDHGEQMIPPVRALASQYVGVRYRTRSPPVEEVVPWRIIGAVDGTRLTFDPPQGGAPTQLNAHQVAEFDAPGPFVVTSQDTQHPFYFAQYMSGGGDFQGVGDPDYVNVISPSQFLPRYTFFTDPTYPETNLVLVRVKDAASGLFPDVSIECAGTIGGWAPVGSSGTFEFTRFDLSTGDFEPNGQCNNGVHTVTGSFPAAAGSATPFFSVTVWGWGNTITDPNPDDAASAVDLEGEANPNFTRWVSYGYTAGANILPLNTVTLSAH
jgi:hypothetical protein